MNNLNPEGIFSSIISNIFSGYFVVVVILAQPTYHKFDAK